MKILDNLNLIFHPNFDGDCHVYSIFLKASIVIFELYHDPKTFLILF